ncbi:RecT-like ssDNA annealing protein [Gordonia phage McKinley]|uniref:RecT-like DNA pairing protein n=1 Tax=Gordonia phage McKinley TaxID=2588507 RepID=A0A4Y6EL76_9CAUD|nr:RecT-like ssDNA annealing protein [Gordonia phage McKinley]QDF19476.1 RecT-like DNA pairing protein [Gordonia phage McKinley]
MIELGKGLAERATAEVQQGDDKPPTLFKQIDSMQVEFQRAMPQGAEARQLVRDAQTALRQVKDLGKCEPSTVLGALMTCAQLGLRPGVLGQAYVLPFWDNRDKVHKAQLIVGYKGLLSLVYRSGMVETVAARIIYEHDEWLLEYGLGEDTLIHRPPAGFGERGKPVAYYAIARMKGGGYAITDPMSVEEMQAHAAKHSKASRFGPWKDHFDQMALKTMLRKLCATLPQSTTIEQAIMHDGAVRADTSTAAVDHTPEYVDSEVVDDGGEGEAGPAELTPQQQIERGLQSEGITDPENVAKWLQNILGDPDAPQTPAELTDAEAGQVLDAIRASNDK